VTKKVVSVFVRFHCAASLRIIKCIVELQAVSTRSSKVVEYKIVVQYCVYLYKLKDYDQAAVLFSNQIDNGKDDKVRLNDSICDWEMLDL
jgi:hypothetical protein